MNLNFEHKKIFSDIRNQLAGTVVGKTRDNELLNEISKILYVKSYFKPTKLNGTAANFYQNSYKKLTLKLKNIFKDQKINLSDKDIEFIDKKINYLDFDKIDGDPIGDLYEIFGSSNIKYDQGQFFTPSVAIKLLIEIINPKKNELIIDPACGAGGFLYFVTKKLIQKNIKKEKIRNQIYGIEKDETLSNMSNIHLSILLNNPANIICADSIKKIDYEGKDLSKKFNSKFDIILSNPPFGKKIISAEDNVRKNFDLAYKWTLDNGSFKKTNILQKRTSPQILFLENIIKSLKNEGRAGMVVPESLISTTQNFYISDYLLKNCKIIAVIGMPEDLFKTSGKGGTHTKTCLIIFKKSKKNKGDVYFAEAKWCGHDSRGNIIEKNDLPTILKDYQNFIKTKKTEFGYSVPQNNIKSFILSPRYNSKFKAKSKKFTNIKKEFELISIKELIEDKKIEIRTGDEVGKKYYGTGDIPFIRTSDITDGKIKLETKHKISEDKYFELKKKQDLKENDILFVKDGTYLVGNSGLIREHNLKSVYQSHIYKIRVLDVNFFSSYYFIYSLSSEFVNSQIKQKMFSMDIIDSIGSRINEVSIPIIKNKKKMNKISNLVKKKYILADLEFKLIEQTSKISNL
tara:strand:+ start:147 stop:2033 length:1887 start_codon:yes stop_codon:yes gene_type:complete